MSPLELLAPDGKRRKTQCANTEGLLRIIQSISSPKAEPFKRWLVKVGYERLEEIENPELAAARMRELYKAKGYCDEWIEKPWMYTMTCSLLAGRGGSYRGFFDNRRQ